jgi:hypothetical protein
MKPQAKLRTRFIRFGVGSEIKQIVDGMPQILFAAEIAFRRLHGCMANRNWICSSSRIAQANPVLRPRLNCT